MSVYVDSAFIPYGNMRMSHLMADTLEELHAMADRIGVKRKHFQGDHYDICRYKRTLAIKFGAQVKTARELVELRRARRLA